MPSKKYSKKSGRCCGGKASRGAKSFSSAKKGKRGSKVTFRGGRVL